MKKIFLYLNFCFLFFYANLFSQYNIKIVQGSIKPVEEKVQGFLGAYHPFNGTIYSGFGWNEGELIQKAFAFGENAIISQAAYSGYTFKENIINNCVKWKVNKVYGILRPPSEKGKINQPADTILLKPFNNYPGMIQGAHRFSQLSKKYPQIYGLIIDDFYNDYPKDFTIEDLRDIRDALSGKYIDKNGNVDHASKAETPNLKLYIVVYNHQLDRIDKKILELIDGVSFWIWDQNDSYKNYDNYIRTLEETYPGKEIISGVYINNGKVEEITSKSIHYLLDEAIKFYDKGDLNGLLIFSPVWMSKEKIEKQRWDDLALPKLLENIYYKYLGKAEGKILDKKTNEPIGNVIVTASRIIDNNKIITAKKLTDNSGNYNFGAWNKRNNIYEIEFSKTHYKSESIQIKLESEAKVIIPDIRLQKSIGILSK